MAINGSQKLPQRPLYALFRFFALFSPNTSSMDTIRQWCLEDEGGAMVGRQRSHHFLLTSTSSAPHVAHSGALTPSSMTSSRKMDWWPHWASGPQHTSPRWYNNQADHAAGDPASFYSHPKVWWKTQKELPSNPGHMWLCGRTEKANSRYKIVGQRWAGGKSEENLEAGTVQSDHGHPLL